ncbi:MULTISPECIES: hypothetical protein [Halorussus]|uniref:hypothetical protein n=1 Tax=Halorussus TaxID=1070314 RepID=UPI00209E6CEB|nr:hypothetical protein [Halorussus vallis]USZ76027.1 hypothetical protein NGM07_01585 [Halorussus vallis]
MKDSAIALLSGLILVTVYVLNMSIVHLLLASTLFGVALLNAVPMRSEERKRRAVLLLGGTTLLVVLPVFAADKVGLTLIVGGIVAIAVVEIKGPAFRWHALALATSAVLVSAGLAYRASRLTAFYVLLLGAIVGSIGVIYYWRTA